ARGSDRYGRPRVGGLERFAIRRYEGGTMKLLLALASVLSIAAFAYAQQHPPSAGIHVDPAKVAEALAKGGTLVTRRDLLVQGSHRYMAGQVEVQDKEHVDLYILEA